MTQKIDCVDWSITNDEAMRVFQARLPNALRVNSVGQMVRLIEQRLGDRGQIRRLQIFGKGIAGAQGLGNSRTLFQANLYNQISIGADSEVHYRDILGRLTSRFIRGGWAELHGCRVGAGAPG